MLTKQELYDILKNDGARLHRAVNFMSQDELVEMYKDRFGIDPTKENEQPNSDKLSDGDEMTETNDGVIKLLRFDESGWCTALNKAYRQGLYRPVSYEEYLALKKYAAEEIEA